MKSNQARKDTIDLARRHPVWAEQRALRFSIRRAIAAMNSRRVGRMITALTVAHAIHRVQDQTKAAKTFEVLSLMSAANAMGYSYTGDLLTAGIWACTTPLLLLHARRAKISKAHAQAFLSSRY